MIRPYKKDDLETMVQIAYKAWAKIFEGFRKDLGEDLYNILYNIPSQDKRVQLTNFTEKYPDWCLLCERNGKVVGFATFYLDNDRKVGLLLNNAADPECGEKGVGQEMYQAVFDHMKACGKKMVYVTTGLDYAHAPARRAYRRAGFKNEQLSVTYYRMLD
jgi:ribosomal protein S18 acetylase RimI-like enzyme